MNRETRALVGGCILGWGSVGIQADPAQAGGPVKVKELGHCQLTNVEFGRDLFIGSCVIKEMIDGAGSSVSYSITMGSSEPLLFVSSDGGKTWVTGRDHVKFHDRVFAAIFRWANLRLEIQED